MLTTYRLWQMRRAGAADGAQGEDLVEERIQELLGPQPELRLRDHQRHAQIAAGLKKAGLLSEVRDDLETAKKNSWQHSSRGLLQLGIAGAAVAEWLGAAWVLGALGFGPLERTVLGFFVACVLVLLTAKVVEQAPGEQEPEFNEALPRPRTRVRLFLLIYAVLIAALAIARFEAHSDELSGLGKFAHAVLMVLASVGPAWTAERLLAKLRPAHGDYTQLRLLRERERVLSREVEHAERFTAGVSDGAERWQATAARLRAAYRVSFRLAASQAERDSAAITVVASPRRPS